MHIKSNIKIEEYTWKNNDENVLRVPTNVTIMELDSRNKIKT